jgi:polysaccharide biosynthesis transport protein
MENTPELIYSDYSEPEDTIDIQDYVRVIVKRRRLIIALFAGICIVGLFLTLTATPIYEAIASITIERENSNILSLQDFMLADPISAEYYQTQYKILESRSVARKAIARLRLDKNELFFSMCASKDDSKPAVSDKTSEEKLVGAFLSGLSIEPVRNSRLVLVKYQSTDPALAATLANTVVDAYMDHMLATKLASIQNAMQWLNDNMDVEKNKVEKAEQALLLYKGTHGIVTDFTGDTETITAQKLAQLNAQVVEAETARVEAETRYKQALAFAPSQDMLDSIPEVLNNGLIQQIKTMEVGLAQRRSELTKRYGPNHPQMIVVQSELKTLQAKKELEIGRIINSLNNTYKVTLAKENSLKEALADQKNEALNLSQKAVEYTGLYRETQSGKEMYALLLKRFKETSIAENLKADNIRMVDKAEVPNTPIKPRKLLNLLATVLLGLGISLGMAFLLEYLDDSIGLPEDIQRHVQIPFMGLVPLHEAKAQLAGAAKTAPQLEAFLAPRSPVSEAYRGIRTNILFSPAETKPQVLLVSSAAAQEGKTTTAANIAIVMAQYGYRVVLIDCDFHRPQVGKLFGISQEQGMTDLLSGSKELREAVCGTVIPNLSVIPSGLTPPNPSEMLGSDRMHALLELLRQHFDKIIIDSSPLNAVTDALVASSAVDSVVLVVRAGVTNCKKAKSAVEKLKNIGTPVLGAVLNGVDLVKDGYYYTEHYYGYDSAADRKCKNHKMQQIKRMLPFFDEHA